LSSCGAYSSLALVGAAPAVLALIGVPALRLWP
jgi:hypothetical protein